jgi:hypothetical protein
MKTAMQLMVKYLQKEGLYQSKSYNHAIKLLEKEKQQIQKSYKDHHDLGHIYGLDTEKYYNQNYNLN